MFICTESDNKNFKKYVLGDEELLWELMDNNYDCIFFEVLEEVIQKANKKYNVNIKIIYLDLMAIRREISRLTYELVKENKMSGNALNY